jgi:Fungal chitosanase of glycosyl hydrolase group 75
MRWVFLNFVLLGVLVCNGQPTKTVYKMIGSRTVYETSQKKVYMVTTGMSIDADGSPHAYHKDNSIALDYLANAGKTGNWWALATDNGKRTGTPLVQTATDPAPGYYISMTALLDKTKKYSDPRRYVDSETIPYIAMPPGFSTEFKLGDIALVVNRKNNKRCYAIFADVGPKNAIGEGSIALAQQLGINGNPKKGGASGDVVYIFLKNSGTGKVLASEEIEKIGKSKLTEAEILEILK